MTDHSRRDVMKRLMLSAGLGAALGGLHPAIARALDIPAKVRTGTIMDVEHVVILTQENRSFDHYFGAMNGVRGFGDRFPIPVPDTATRKGKTVWVQPNEKADGPPLIAPFALNTQQNFKHMRVEGTPHTFPDAQAAWDEGRMGNWPDAKHNHSMGYFTRADMPFQYALAEAFTICDAYHCAMHAGTNPNRMFIWTGTNDALGQGHGPVLNNEYDDLTADGEGHGGYTWVTYPERLQAAGISWQVYQDMKNNFTDNPLAGFKFYREADKAKDGPLLDIANRSVRTRHLDKLKEDVLGNKLPQVSWIVAPDYGSEHPGPSSPAQGADYTAQVLEALTANPDVWSKTVFLINFDENDGYFDHVPPPAPPSRDPADPSKLLGNSNIDLTGEYHLANKQEKYKNRPYGLGPRVPMYVISPWSKGGYVASEVFDHTSCIRLLEARFGVKEPNISAWRRAVCGDLTSCFDFKTPNDQAFFAHLPKTAELAAKAKALGGHTTPPVPQTLSLPVQEKGVRSKRATPYRLIADFGYDPVGTTSYLMLENNSLNQSAVFHLYDMMALEKAPQRITLRTGTRSNLPIPKHNGRYDFWLIGPDGFHRHFMGSGQPLWSQFDGRFLTLSNMTSPSVGSVTIVDEAYAQVPQTHALPAGPAASEHVTQLSPVRIALDVSASHGWYDFSVRADGLYQRFAGHVETGQPSFSDPAMFGAARGDQV